jgi:hypothetical protein
MSAPTVRFLRTMEQLNQFSTAERHTIAVDLYTEIKPFVAAVNLDEMLCAAEALQARRWGLVYRGLSQFTDRQGGVAGLVGIEGGVVSGVINLESSGVEASDWRPRHDEHYYET